MCMYSLLRCCCNEILNSLREDDDVMMIRKETFGEGDLLFSQSCQCYHKTYWMVYFLKSEIQSGLNNDLFVSLLEGVCAVHWDEIKGSESECLKKVNLYCK